MLIGVYSISQSSIYVGFGGVNLKRKEYGYINEYNQNKIYDRSYCLSFGYNWEYVFKNRLALKTGLDGVFYKFQYSDKLQYTTHYYATISSKESLLSATVPIMLGYYPGKFRFAIGPEVEFKLYQKIDYISGETFYSDYWIDESYSRAGLFGDYPVNLLGRVDIGYRLNPQLGLSLKAHLGYNLQMINLNLAYYFKSRKMRKEEKEKMVITDNKSGSSLIYSIGQGRYQSPYKYTWDPGVGINLEYQYEHAFHPNFALSTGLLLSYGFYLGYNNYMMLDGVIPITAHYTTQRFRVYLGPGWRINVLRPSIYNFYGGYYVKSKALFFGDGVFSGIENLSILIGTYFKLRPQLEFGMNANLNAEFQTIGLGLRHKFQSSKKGG